MNRLPGELAIVELLKIRSMSADELRKSIGWWSRVAFFQLMAELQRQAKVTAWDEVELVDIMDHICVKKRWYAIRSETV